MIKFFKVFFRKYFRRNKLTLLNIGGLALGMFTFIFIYFYVFIEGQYDTHLENSDRIYHIYTQVKKNGVNTLYSTSPIHLGEALYSEIPQVESWATFCTIFETSVVHNGETDFLNPEILYANPEFLDVFKLQLLNGSFNDETLQPGTAVISRSAALKYFGQTYVSGKQLEVLFDGKEPLTITIKAVVDDMPKNSNIQFDLICNLDDYVNIIGDWIAQWVFKVSQTYVLLKPNTDIALLDRQINQVVDKNMNDRTDKQKEVVKMFTENISEKYNKKGYTFQQPQEVFINPASLKILFAVGLITLIISWLNYINFAVFQNSYHLKEIGIRRIVGSGRKSLFFKLLNEALVLSSIPLLLSVLLFYLAAPALYRYYDFSMENLRVDFGLFWLIILSLLIGGSLLSALYPTLQLMRFQPVMILRNNRMKKPGSINKSKILLTVQFALSIILISSIILINNQMSFIQSQYLGFEKERVLVLSPPITKNAEDYARKMELFKIEAMINPHIISMAGSNSVPGKNLVTEHFGIKNREETINKYLRLNADENYFDVIGVKFLAGHNFSLNPEQRVNEIIINETLAERLGFTNITEAIGQPGNYDNTHIIGVVEDYNHFSLHEPIKPILFRYGLNGLTYFMIKYKSDNPKQDIEFLREKWKQVFANSPFQYSFLEDEYSVQYTDERRLFSLVTSFSIISVIITVLGVIGFCLNETRLRTREIGIRKVNGAKAKEILAMLNRELLIWVAVAFFVGIPVSIYAMNKWLESFAYKTNLSWWVFALSGVIAMGIALITVSFQSLRAASRNPVEALRYE